MTRQSKRRKGLPQSTTLHQFFPDATARKKPRDLSPTASLCQAEVITVPDCAEELLTQKGKKRARRDSSAVFVGNPDTTGSKPDDSKEPLLPVRMNKQTETTIINTCEGHSFIPKDEDTFSFGEPSAPPTGSPVQLVQTDITPTLFFGPPNELLSNGASSDNPISCPSHDSYNLKIELSESHQGISMKQAPSLIPMEAEAAQKVSLSFTQPIHAGISPDSIAIHHHLDDKCAMSDEVMAFVDAEMDDNNDDGLSQIDLLPTAMSSFVQAKGERGTTCPVCTTLLSGLSSIDIEKHVNMCIDKLPISSLPSVPTTSSTRVLLLPPASQAPRSTSPPSGFTHVRHKSIDGSNAFSVLMSTHKDNEAWEEAAVAEDRNLKINKENRGRRKAPFYKVLQGMPIAVDAFRYGSIPGVTAYFLTHAHSDHYTNLASNWKSGPIYCSQGTANLIIHMLAIDPKWVHPLPMDIPSIIPNTNGVRVTLIEANHCPGSCLFLFEGPQTINAGDSVFKSPFVGSSRTFRYLHCGDFRASPRHVLHPAVKGKQIDHVYLDTTYLDPKYNFPPQPLVVSACAELAKRIINGQNSMNSASLIGLHTIKNFMTVQNKPSEEQGKILIVVGTYSIGKERIVKAIARALNTKVYCDERKAAILRCQADPELNSLLVADPLSAGVHVVPLDFITSDKLKIYMDRFKGKYARTIGFRPTGWTYKAQAGFEQSLSISSVLSHTVSRPMFTYASLYPSRNSTSTVTLYGVPYSEHSSFFELTCFALSLEWGKIIATVNVSSVNSRGNISRWIDKWQAERKRREKWQIVKYRELDYW